ncbi:MAG: hypothetical protein KatS3mg051_1073 [Anaerolineae bacterium]|nr:MAG: hypothetical protein KatS3mg051_1073 [Anaerolineae bacterium]
MTSPTRSDVHVDAVLTGISVAYIQSQTDFIATRVFPIVPVDKRSDVFYTYTKNDWFRDEAQRPGARHRVGRRQLRPEHGLVLVRRLGVPQRCAGPSCGQ